MSRQDFILALTLYAKDLPFESLIMAAMLQTEDEAIKKKLKKAFPKLWEELEARSQAPGGRLDSDDLPSSQ
ncbi:MAG: hypothetical protein D6814_05940 [Calditrichaeota bacterium]|nr:MAG: hypothetical protein D6814_05940 [Calditrichota bacterium]